MKAQPLDTSLENQVTPVLDTRGRVVGGTLSRSGEDARQFMATLRQAAERYPVDPADIVMPAGWPVDPDGRGWTYLEVRAANGGVAVAAMPASLNPTQEMQP